MVHPATQRVMQTDRSTASTRDRRLQRAAQLQKREQLRNSVANRIQRVYRKSPDTARGLADKVLALIKGTPREKNLNEQELRELLRKVTAGNKGGGDRGGGGGASGSSGQSTASREPATAASAIDGSDAVANGSNGPNSAITARMYSTTTARQFETVAAHYGDARLNILPQASLMSPPKNDIWSEMSREMAKKVVVDKKASADALAKKRSVWREQLDEQVSRHNASKPSGNDRNDDREREIRNFDAWRAEEDAKEAGIKARAHATGAACQAQLADKAKRAAVEKRRADAEDAAHLARAAKAISDEADKQARMKARARAATDKLLVDNAANEVLREEARKLRHEEETKTAKLFVQMENKKDADRRSMLDAQQERIQRFMSMGNEAVERTDQRAKDDEERALRWQAKYDADRDASEKAKQDKLRSDKVSQMKTLDEQIARQKRLKEKQKADDALSAKVWHDHTMAGGAAAKAKEDRAKKAAQDQGAWLEKRIRANAQKKMHPDQSSLEVQLNKKVLEKLKHQTRMGMGGSQAQALAQAREEASRA